MFMAEDVYRLTDSFICKMKSTEWGYSGKEYLLTATESYT
jgi:hypothetical protein